MKTLDITKLPEHSAGAYGVYYKLDYKKGVKVIGSRGHKTIKALKRSRIWREATKETTLIRKIHKRFENTPKSLGTIVIKARKRYYPGILMEHINGKHLREIYKVSEREDICDQLTEQLAKVGVIHDDVHPGNVLVCNKTKKFYIIDFTPDYTEVVNE